MEAIPGSERLLLAEGPAPALSWVLRAELGAQAEPGTMSLAGHPEQNCAPRAELGTPSLAGHPEQNWAPRAELGTLRFQECECHLDAFSPC